MVQAENAEKISKHVYWVDIKLAQQRGLKFYQTRSNAIIFYDTLPAYCVPKAIMMETGEFFFTRKYMRHLGLLQRFPLKIIGGKNWIQNLLEVVKTPNKSNQNPKANYQARRDLFCQSNNPVRVKRSGILLMISKPQGEWDRIAELMMIKFSESGHPVLRAASPLSRGTLKSKGGGKLSIHFCADEGYDGNCFFAQLFLLISSVFTEQSQICVKNTNPSMLEQGDLFW